jgi:hypothetical protein
MTSHTSTGEIPESPSLKDGKLLLEFRDGKLTSVSLDATLSSSSIGSSELESGDGGAGRNIENSDHEFILYAD